MGDDRAELQRRNRELSILNTIADALNRQVDLTQALNTALLQVAELFGLETGWVWLTRGDGGNSYLAAAQNLPRVLVDEPHRMEGSCYCLDTFREGDLAGAANVNIVTCSRLKHIVAIAEGLRYHASIPLYAQESGHERGERRKLGVLNVASADWSELSADDLRLLHTIGDMVGIAVERAHLFERSAELGALEERNRLAREIHDTLAQGLAAISMQLETADELLGQSANPARTQAAIQQALKLSRANLEEARRSVLDLRSAPLEGRNLCEALTALLKEYETRWKIQTSFEAVGAHRPLPPRIEMTLYRIAQEALTNVVRHANAQHVAVRVSVTPEQIELEIEDDGAGFDPSQAQAAQNRYGLVGLSERARLIGGSLEVKSAPGHGTCVEVRVPLP